MFKLRLKQCLAQFQVNELRKKLDDKDDEIDQLKASVESGSEQMQGLHFALAARNIEIDDLKDQLKASQSGATGSNVRIKELEARIADIEPQLEDALHDVRSLMTKCEHMQKGLSQAQEREEAFAKTREELDGVRASLAGLQAEHAQLNQVHEEAQIEISVDRGYCANNGNDSKLLLLILFLW